MTNLNSDTRELNIDELTIDELDAVNGGSIFGRVVEAMREAAVDVVHRVFG
jgi:bacteriocin-like protein